MHEYSITCSILEILEKIIKEKNLKKIKKSKIRIEQTCKYRTSIYKILF